MTEAIAEKGEKLEKLKQSRLPGLTKGDAGKRIKKIQEVEDAADDYDRTVKERMELTKKEIEKHDELLRKMTKNKVNEYRINNTIFRMSRGKDKVKRVRVTEDEGGE